MRRSAGVTLTALLLLLGAVMLLWSCLQTIVAIMSTPRGSQMTDAARNSLLASALLLLGISIWCGATAIGLSILALWARRSVLALSLLLMLTSATTAAMLAFYLKPGRPISAAAAVTPITQRGLLFFYGLLTLLGGWWLYFFSRKHVKAQFEKHSA